MAVQTSFAKKMTWFQECNHRFLALVGNDSELDLALLDVKNRVRDLSLREDETSFDPKIFLAKVGEGKTISKYRTSQASLFLARAALSPDENRARQ
jgi:hypothetical protein